MKIIIQDDNGDVLIEEDTNNGFELPKKLDFIKIFGEILPFMDGFKTNLIINLFMLLPIEKRITATQLIETLDKKHLEIIKENLNIEPGIKN